MQVPFTWNLSPLRPSKFSFEYLLLPPRSALGAVSRRLTPRAASRRPRPPTHGGLALARHGRPSAARFSVIHFRGYLIRQVSCYTLLSGFRLPWPPSGCLDELTPFVVSDERAFRHFNFTFGSSRIASSAYQKWPTRNSHSHVHVHLSNKDFLHI